LGGYNMKHCRSPDGVTSISVRPYYTMLSRVYLALAMGFLVYLKVAKIVPKKTYGFESLTD